MFCTCKTTRNTKVTHMATTFILQKSSEMLSMFKAPFKRKTNNTPATTPKDAPNTPNNGRNVSATTSNRTSAVNCINHLSDDSVSLCDKSDASNSNIYTEIDLLNRLPTKDLLTESNSTNPSGSLSSAILSCLFDEPSNLMPLTIEIATAVETIQTANYANESVTFEIDNAVNETEQNLYDIDSIANNATLKKPLYLQSDFKEADNFENLPKVNGFFTNLSKSLKYKFKSMPSNDDSESEDLETGDKTPLASGTTSNDVNASDDSNTPKDIVDKLSLTKRLKSKFKTGLNFFKDTKVRFCSYWS